jgi:hypothetical protein
LLVAKALADILKTLFEQRIGRGAGDGGVHLRACVVQKPPKLVNFQSRARNLSHVVETSKLKLKPRDHVLLPIKAFIKTALRASGAFLVFRDYDFRSAMPDGAGRATMES